MSSSISRKTITQGKSNPIYAGKSEAFSLIELQVALLIFLWVFRITDPGPWEAWRHTYEMTLQQALRWETQALHHPGVRRIRISPELSLERVSWCMDATSTCFVRAVLVANQTPVAAIK